MTRKTISVLEFDKIKKKLEEEAGSEMAKKRISELRVFDDIDDANDSLAETDEALRLISGKGVLPVGSFYDVAPYAALASKGGVLTMKQLLEIRYDLMTAARVISFLKGDDVPDLPIHKAITEVLDPLSSLDEDIDRSIDSETEMNDNASRDLRRIRAEIAGQNDAIKNRLNRMISSDAYKTILQDAIVTVRDGRYVVPVKTEYKGSVPGIVHDQSASGATLFIEPQAVVDANNKLRELESEEKAEIDRILRDFSERVAVSADIIKNNQELLTQLDFITAKGKLAWKMDAARPQLNEDNILELKGARHPLIDEKKVIPIDVAVGEGYTALIITGPNTGGKTVTLKTAGLLQIMAQCGLFIPAYEGSRVPMLRQVYADIGDEQSIEQSLSTFSSHMKNIVGIVEDAGYGTMVLVDELGAGTDPTEGAALAIAILEDLIRKGALIIATTHYTELKKYALSSDNVENGSMEFDVTTLSPTYRLKLGVPGKSNAFEISGKLGLDRAIIDEARELIEGKDLEFEDVLSAIEADKKKAETERNEAVRMNAEIKQRAEELEKEREKFEAQKEKLLKSAREEARDMIADAKKVSEEVKEDLKELARLESLGERNKRFDQNRRRIKDAAGKYKEKYISEKNDDPVNIDTVKIGDRVRVVSLGQNGEIIGLPDDKGEMQVRVGMMKLRVGASDLKIINDGRKKKKKQPSARAKYGGLMKQKAQTVPLETDVRGQSLDEALANVEKYIDDAYIAGLPKVTVIHGRGEGILQKGIRDALRRNRSVASFERGAYDQGGEGVTVVTLKRS